MERLIDEATTAVLKNIFNKTMLRNVDIKMYSSQKGEFAEFTSEFLRELALISERVNVVIFGTDEGRKLGFFTDPYIVFGEDLGYRIFFSGTPAGHEASTLIETIKMVSAGDSGLSSETLEALKQLDKPVKLQTFVTTTCTYCPQAATMANRFAVAKAGFITSEVIEAEENLEISRELDISSVPVQIINDDRAQRLLGVQPESKFLMEVLKHGSNSYKEIMEAQERKKREAMILRDNPESVIMLGDANFKEAVKKYPRLVVDCWAEWCAPCRVMEPIIKELAGKYAGRVVYGKLNVDENPQISADYNLTSIPTILIFDKGAISSSILGAQTRQALEDQISRTLKLIVI